MKQIYLEFLAICYTGGGLMEKSEETRVAGRERGRGTGEEWSGKKLPRLPVCTLTGGPAGGRFLAGTMMSSGWDLVHRRQP